MKKRDELKKNLKVKEKLLLRTFLDKQKTKTKKMAEDEATARC